MIIGDLNDEGETIAALFTSTNIIGIRRKLIDYSEKETPCRNCCFESIICTSRNMKRAKIKGWY